MARLGAGSGEEPPWLAAALLALGVAAQAWPGLPGALVAFTIAGLCQTGYLWWANAGRD